jgi:hypothetical protein
MNTYSDNGRAKALRTVLSLALFIAACAGRPLSAQTATCLGTADDSSVRLRTYLRTLVSGSDESSVQMRAALGIATMDPAKVSVVTDARTCPKILTGVNSALKTPTVSRSMYVYAIGKNYAAFDSSEVVESQGGAVVFLDSQYKLKQIVLAPSVY